jgi:hypothetical protein
VAAIRMRRLHYLRSLPRIEEAISMWIVLDDKGLRLEFTESREESNHV